MTWYVGYSAVGRRRAGGQPPSFVGRSYFHALQLSQRVYIGMLCLVKFQSGRS